MNPAEKQILQLVADGKITSAEGAQLLDALRDRSRKGWKLLLDPFERLPLWLAAVLVATMLAGSVALERFGVRFFGAFTLRVTDPELALAWPQLAAEVASGWVGPAFALFLASRVVAKRGRIVDFLVVIGVARIPLVIAGTVALFAFTGKQEIDAFAIAIVYSLVIPAYIWMVTLMYVGFRSAAGLHGIRATVTFIVTAVVGELAIASLLFWWVGGIPR